MKTQPTPTLQRKASPVKNRPAISRWTRSGLLVLSLTSLALGACGKQQFQKTDVALPIAAAGDQQIPPQLDILIFQDDTGSMRPLVSQMRSQMPAFLQSLNNKGWDYRFAILPLTTTRSITPGAFQIAASQQDLNWKNEVEGWRPPYDGMDEALADQVMGGFFRRPFGTGFAPTYSNFLSDYEAGANNTGTELGLKNIAEQLAVVRPHLFRENSLKIVLVIGNGDDSEGYCANPNNPTIMQPCSNWAQIVDNRIQQISTATQGRVAFYSAVAARRYNGTSCMGTTSAYAGSGYIRASQMLSGSSIDICAGSSPAAALSSMLAAVEGSLPNIRLQYKQNYVFIPEQPLESSIQVVKYIGGDRRNAVTLPQDASNGWTYVGYTTQYTIFYPAPMNRQTGWAVRLNGSAILNGNDTAEVIYTTP